MHVRPPHQRPPLNPKHYERRHVSIRGGHIIISHVSYRRYQKHPFTRVCRKHPFTRVVRVSHQVQRGSDKKRRYMRRRGRNQDVQNNEMNAIDELQAHHISQQGGTQDSTRRRTHQWNTKNQVGPGHIPVPTSLRQWKMSLPHPMNLFQDYSVPISSSRRHPRRLRSKRIIRP